MTLHLCALEQESRRLGVFALSLAERLHEFFEFGASLDLEEHFVVSVGDFDIQVFVASRGGCRQVPCSVW